jgi:hypothetical protein
MFAAFEPAGPEGMLRLELISDTPEPAVVTARRVMVGHRIGGVATELPPAGPPMQATIGFRVKSGWAAAVLLAATAARPQVVEHRVLELSDPAVPTSRQPYHAGIGIAQRDLATLERLVAGVRRYAEQSIAEWVAGCRAAGYQVDQVGIVVGSDVDPDSIPNPHVRAHAAEGRLFRSVVEAAAGASGLSSTTFIERELFAHAANLLGRSEAALRRDLAELGRTLHRPWRGEQKAAAAAAWMVLASASR